MFLVLETIWSLVLQTVITFLTGGGDDGLVLVLVMMLLLFRDRVMLRLTRALEMTVL